VPARAEGVAFGPDGRTLVLAGSRTRVWDLEENEEIEAFGGPASSVAVGRDGTIATGGLGTVSVRDADGRARSVPGGAGTSCVVLAPDGRTLATASGGAVQLWNVGALGQPARVLENAGPVNCLAFSPDGRTIATGGYDGTLRLWDVETAMQLGEPLDRYVGRAQTTMDVYTHVVNDLAPVSGVAFSPGGTLLASSHATGTVRLWDVSSRRQLGPALRARDGALQSVELGSDGRTLATSGRNGVARLWHGLVWSGRDDLRAQVCGLLVGSLSRADWDRFVPGVPYRSACGS
jgi:WD40 repeat protein